MIISIFKEDNILSMTINLPYSPPMHTDNDHNQIFFCRLFCITSCVIFVRRREASACPIMLSTK